MTLIQQKRREEIEAHKKAEELQKVEDADRKKKQERLKSTVQGMLGTRVESSAKIVEKKAKEFRIERL